MNFLKRITDLFRGGGSTNNRHFPIYVMSRRCREPLAGQIDLLNELSLDEDETSYYSRKVLHTTGRTRCFDQVEVLVWFDKNKQLLRQEVAGGEWLDEAAYSSAVAAFEARLAEADAPPTDNPDITDEPDQTDKPEHPDKHDNEEK